MVKNIKYEEIINTPIDERYTEFELFQYIVDLNIGDKVEIKIEPIDGSGEIKKEFVAKFTNCHINCLWQDKGIKTIKEISEV